MDFDSYKCFEFQYDFQAVLLCSPYCHEANPGLDVQPTQSLHGSHAIPIKYKVSTVFGSYSINVGRGTVSASKGNRIQTPSPIGLTLSGAVGRPAEGRHFNSASRTWAGHCTPRGVAVHIGSVYRSLSAHAAETEPTTAR